MEFFYVNGMILGRVIGNMNEFLIWENILVGPPSSVFDWLQ